MLRKVLIAKSNNVFQKGRPGWPCIILIQGAPSFCEMFVALPPSLGHVHELGGLIVASNNIMDGFDHLGIYLSVEAVNIDLVEQFISDDFSVD